MLRKESAAEVREAIDRLPQTLRASVILHYLDGCSIDQVASFLQIDVDAAKKRLQRGRERVKKDLERKIRDAVREHRPGKDSTLLEAVNIYTNFNIAAPLGQIALLEAMLVDGIDVNEVDATGRTLLHWAIENGHLEAVELLLKSGADQNIRDREGRSPRHLAQVSKSGSAVMRLLNAHRPAHDRVQACSDGGTRRQPGPR